MATNRIAGQNSAEGFCCWNSHNITTFSRAADDLTTYYALVDHKAEAVAAHMLDSASFRYSDVRKCNITTLEVLCYNSPPGRSYLHCSGSRRSAVHTRAEEQDVGPCNTSRWNGPLVNVS